MLKVFSYNITNAFFLSKFVKYIIIIIIISSLVKKPFNLIEKLKIKNQLNKLIKNVLT